MARMHADGGNHSAIFVQNFIQNSSFPSVRSARSC